MRMIDGKTIMPEIVISWAWKLESPLHCGSGISQAGFADRLIQRDEHGWPIIPGDAVKGALRLSAEQIFAWLGNQQERIAYGEVAEPTHPLLARLFGGSACARFEAARPQVDAATMRLPGTRINRTTGRADDNTLRTIEVLAPGVLLTTRCRLWPQSDEEGKLLGSFLLACVAATESIGGRAGAGWGRVSPAAVEPRPNEIDWCALEATIRSKPDACHDAARQVEPIVAADSLDHPQQWWRLELELEEPVCLGARPDVANQQHTLDYIPATALRGALREAWKRSGRSEQEVAFWISEQTRWTNAHPALGNGGEAVPCIPIPRSYSCVKQEAGLSGAHGIHDASSKSEPDPVDGTTRERLQWRSLRDGWMSFEGADAKGEPRLTDYGQAGLRESRMHVARNYETGSKRSGALCSRDALTATDANSVLGQTATERAATRKQRRRRFVAYARLTAQHPWAARPLYVYVGKRISAGYGRLKLTATPVDYPWPRWWTASQVTGGADDRAHVIVQLLSDALIRDHSGSCTQSIDWQAVLGDRSLPVPTAIEVWATLRPVQQWMSTWGHARSPSTAVTAGSVWRLDFADAIQASTFRAAVERKRYEGLGERAHEGFGWFIVDPPWLGRRSIMGSRNSDATDLTAKKAHDWPGCDNVPREALIGVLDHIENLRIDSKLYGPLQELTTQAREADDRAACDKVLRFCDSMANRGAGEAADKGGTAAEKERKGKGKNAYAWKGLKKEEPVRALLDAAIGRSDEHAASLLRFALDALLVRCPRDQR